MTKIRTAKVIVTCPGRNFVTLKVATDEGVYGLGDATLNGRELAVASSRRLLSDTACEMPARCSRSRAVSRGILS